MKRLVEAHDPDMYDNYMWDDRDLQWTLEATIYSIDENGQGINLGSRDVAQYMEEPDYLDFQELALDIQEEFPQVPISGSSWDWEGSDVIKLVTPNGLKYEIHFALSNVG